MWKLTRTFGCLFCLLALLESCAYSNNQSIHVTLFTENKSIESKVQVESSFGGQKYINISLTNNGSVIDKIDSIQVVIVPSENINNETKLMFGGSCMGRTPLKLTSSSDHKSNSGTFMMMKHNDKNFTNIGILSWNTFLPYIHFDRKKGIIITAVGEHKPLKPGETITFEKIVLSKGESWQDLMYNYGTEIAKEQKIKTKEPVNLEGWSTWDYYGRVYDTKDIFKNIDKLSEEDHHANIIQIDGGWWTARGDYLSVRKDLQGGMKAVADYAKSKGYRAGIHLDGFRGDKNSELFRKHPDWFLRDQNGQVICHAIDKGDTFMQYIYYDYSNPAVCEYMKHVLSTIRTEWGFSYFKIDFIRYGLLESILSEVPADKAKSSGPIVKVQAFNNNMTSIERTRAGLKAMREGIADDYFLGCSAIFGPTFGIVDGLRTGGDIGAKFDLYETRCLQNGGNFYLNKSVVNADADYLVVRNKEDEEAERAWGDKFDGKTTYNEAKMWSDYIALYGGPKISSDNLLTLRPERKKLIENSTSYKTASRFIPLDFWNHATNKTDAFNVMLAENEDCVFISIFNWGATDKKFNLAGLENTILVSPESKKAFNFKGDSFQFDLSSHSSTIVKVEGASFDNLRKSIQLID